MNATRAELRDWWTRGEWHRLVPALRASIAHIAPIVRLDPDDRDDLMQRTIVKCWTIGYVPDDPAAFAGRVAINLTKDRYKQHYLKNRDGSVDVDTFAGAEVLALDTIVQRANVARLKNAFRKLPDALRRALALHDLHGVPCHEIARRFGLKEGAVKMRLYRARRMLGHLYRITPPGALTRAQVPMKARGPEPTPQTWPDITRLERLFARKGTKPRTVRAMAAPDCAMTMDGTMPSGAPMPREGRVA